MLSDTGLGVKHSAINVMINQLVSKEPTKWSFNYNGTDYYFTDPGGIDEYVKKANQMGVTVSIILLMPWDETKQNLIYAGGRKSGHKFYAMNPDDPTVAATFCFLAQRYGQADCHIDNWILGNEVNIPNTYNYCGTLDLNTNASIYAATFIQLYNALQNLNPGARAYIPFDHNWTSNEKGTGIAAKNYLTAFWLAVNARQPGVNWNIAYHLYPPVLTSSKMWLPKYTKYTPNNENAQYISAAQEKARGRYLYELSPINRPPTAPAAQLLFLPEHHAEQPVFVTAVYLISCFFCFVHILFSSCWRRSNFFENPCFLIVEKA